MYVRACVHVCDLVVEQETTHVSTNMKNYVVLELSERKELVFKTACRTYFFCEAKISCIFCLSLACCSLRKFLNHLARGGRTSR